MAVKKATTTEDLTKSAESPAPSLGELVDRVGEVTDSSVLADVESPKTAKVKSPAGFVTAVPESIVDTLLASGYSKSK